MMMTLVVLYVWIRQLSCFIDTLLSNSLGGLSTQKATHLLPTTQNHNSRCKYLITFCFGEIDK